MAPNMRDTFIRGMLKEEADSFIRMVRFMRGSGRTMKHTVKEHTFTKMVRPTLGNGNTIYSMVKEVRSGQMAGKNSLDCEVISKDSTSRVRRMDWENSFGLMELCMRESLGATT